MSLPVTFCYVPYGEMHIYGCSILNIHKLCVGLVMGGNAPEVLRVVKRPGVTHSAAGTLVEGAALAGMVFALDAEGSGGAGLSATAAFGTPVSIDRVTSGRLAIGCRSFSCQMARKGRSRTEEYSTEDLTWSDRTFRRSVETTTLRMCHRSGCTLRLMLHCRYPDRDWEGQANRYEPVREEVCIDPLSC